jgi:hypothetical protein
MAVKKTKCPLSIPKGCKIDQISIKYTNLFHCKTLPKLPKFGFWLKNTPSGNPGSHSLEKP